MNSKAMNGKSRNLGSAKRETVTGRKQSCEREFTKCLRELIRGKKVCDGRT